MSTVDFSGILGHYPGTVNVGPHAQSVQLPNSMPFSPVASSGSTTTELDVRAAPRPARSANTLAWVRRRPKRVTRGSWYFIEDNTIPDGQVLLQAFSDGHGEARCSYPTRTILDGSDTACRHMMSHYSAARDQMPMTVMADVARWAPGHLKDMRRALDPMVQLRDGVNDLLAELVKTKGEVDTYRAQELVSQYGRVRDRVAELRGEFSAIEDAFELMQEKLMAVLGGGDE